MAGRIIVMVSDLDDSSHGEINVLESMEHAAHFVETLLESGFEQGRLRVFNGDELSMTVHHRPVVRLTTTMTADQTLDGRGRKEDAPEEAALVASTAEDVLPAQVAAVQTPQVRNLAYQEVSAEPFMQNGIRFSSMFKPGA